LKHTFSQERTKRFLFSPGTVRRHPGAVPRLRGFAEPTFRKEGVARKGAD